MVVIWCQQCRGRHNLEQWYHHIITHNTIIEQWRPLQHSWSRARIHIPTYVFPFIIPSITTHHIRQHRISHCVFLSIFAKHSDKRVYFRLPETLLWVDSRLLLILHVSISYRHVQRTLYVEIENKLSVRQKYWRPRTCDDRPTLYALLPKPKAWPAWLH